MVFTTILLLSSFLSNGFQELHIRIQHLCHFYRNLGTDIYSDSEHNMLTNVLNYFYQNRSGADIESKYITSGEKDKLAHAGVHKTDMGYVQNKWKMNICQTMEILRTKSKSVHLSC